MTGFYWEGECLSLESIARNNIPFTITIRNTDHIPLKYPIAKLDINLLLSKTDIVIVEHR